MPKQMPNAVCPNCYQLAHLSPGAEQMCDFCNSELTRGEFFVPLSEFFQQHTLDDLLKQREDQKEKIRATPWRNRRHRFYLKDYLRGINKLIRLRKHWQ